MTEGWGVFLSFLYVGAVLWVVKKGETRWYSPFTARKLIHLFVGTWVLPSFFLFRHWYVAILPPFAFIWINLLLERRRFFSFGASEVGFGTVYFPMSCVILLVLFWAEPLRLCAGCGALALAWGDSLAALVGKKWGRHRYTVKRTEKSFEGSLAMAGGTFAGCVVSFLLFQPRPFETIVFWSASIALLASILESISTRGLDNLTVPLGSAWAAYLLTTRW